MESFSAASKRTTELFSELILILLNTLFVVCHQNFVHPAVKPYGFHDHGIADGITELSSKNGICFLTPNIAENEII